MPAEQLTADEFRADPSYHSEAPSVWGRTGWKTVSVWEPFPFDGYVHFCPDGLAWVEGTDGYTPLCRKS